MRGRSRRRGCAQGFGVPVDARLAGFRSTGFATIGTKNGDLIIAVPNLCVAVHQSIGAGARTLDRVQQAIQYSIPTDLIEGEPSVDRYDAGIKSSSSVGAIGGAGSRRNPRLELKTEVQHVALRKPMGESPDQ